MLVGRIDNSLNNIESIKTDDSLSTAQKPLISDRINQSAPSIDTDRNSSLSSQFLRSRASIGSLRMQEQIKAALGAAKPQVVAEPPVLDLDKNVTDIVYKRPKNGALFING